MIVTCSLVGGGGRNSSFEHGSTSTGSPSHWSGQDRLHFSMSLSLLLDPWGQGSLDDFEGTSHRGVDAAEVGHDLAGAVARGGRDGGAPLGLVLDPADGRRAEAELRRVEVERPAEAGLAVGQRER